MFSRQRQWAFFLEAAGVHLRCIINQCISQWCLRHPAVCTRYRYSGITPSHKLTDILEIFRIYRVSVICVIWCVLFVVDTVTQASHHIDHICRSTVICVIGRVLFVVDTVTQASHHIVHICRSTALGTITQVSHHIDHICQSTVICVIWCIVMCDTTRAVCTRRYYWSITSHRPTNLLGTFHMYRSSVICVIRRIVYMTV